MKNTVSKQIENLLERTKKLTSSPIERELIKGLLTYGSVKTAKQSGYSITDRTYRIVNICSELGIEVIQGNDAPRGGKLGNYVEVFLGDEKTMNIIRVQARLSSIRQAMKRRLQIESEELRTEQLTKLANYFRRNPEFRKMIKEKIETSPSKVWRNWVVMKTCAAMNKGVFNTFKLTAADIRDKVY